MAITLSDIRRESTGSIWSLTGNFTTASGDSSLTITHNFYYVASADVNIKKGGIGTQNPKLTHSAGVTTMVFDDTLGYSGTFDIRGK